ncbi:diacylglycerol kinase family protein [Methanobrevibacter sp.]|uniref:diacylglycerol kinase family protein n=1 Tax=Methanobrevibacter sp. TaxID=66852 RepID=UPI0038698D80
MSIIKSFKDAVNGIINTVSTERNLKIQVIIMMCVISAGLIVGLSNIEWIICIMLFDLVISAELFNTSIEKTLDYIDSDYSEEIRFIKDASAGAVLSIAIASAVIGLIIFIPKLV